MPTRSAHKDNRLFGLGCILAVLALIWLALPTAAAAQTNNAETRCQEAVSKLPGYPQYWTRTNEPGKPWVFQSPRGENITVPEGMVHISSVGGGTYGPGTVLDHTPSARLFCGGVYASNHRVHVLMNKDNGDGTAVYTNGVKLIPVGSVTQFGIGFNVGTPQLGFYEATGGFNGFPQSIRIQADTHLPDGVYDNVGRGFNFELNGETIAGPTVQISVTLVSGANPKLTTRMGQSWCVGDFTAVCSQSDRFVETPAGELIVLGTCNMRTRLLLPQQVRYLGYDGNGNFRNGQGGEIEGLCWTKLWLESTR